MNTLTLTDDEMKIVAALIGAALTSDRVSGAARSWWREENGEALTVEGGAGREAWDMTVAVLADKVIDTNIDER